MKGDDRIDTVFAAYVTNAGRYGEGHDDGGMLRFPATTEAVQSLLKRIGVDGVRYQEVFIPFFDEDTLGVCEYMGEYESINELNHLACLLSELDENELAVLEAVVDKGEHTTSAAELINLVLNLDCYELYPGIHDDETLGRVYVDDFQMLTVPEDVRLYFDYDAYGRDARLNEGGYFAPGGYLLRSDSPFAVLYHGPQDIPSERKVFAYPVLPIREQMAACKDAEQDGHARTSPPPPTVEHDGR